VGEEDSMRNSNTNFENNTTSFCEENATTTIMNPSKNIISIIFSSKGAPPHQKGYRFFNSYNYSNFKHRLSS
jgi:hypothetical protein